MALLLLALLWFPQDDSARAEAALKAGDFREAARLYHRAAQADPSEANLLNLGRHLVAYNGAADAVKVATWGVERHTGSAPLRVVLAAAHYALGAYAEASKAICDAVDADPSDLRTLTFLADLRDVSPAHSGAIAERLKGYVQRYPENAFARFHYAMTMPESGREPELRRARALDADMPGPALELGILLQNQGRLADAEALLLEALRLEPDSQRAHYRLARIYQQTGRLAQAQAELRIVERLKRPPAAR